VINITTWPEEFEKLHRKFPKTRQDLQTFRNETQQFLAEEIVSRYITERSIRASLPNDPVVQKAREVLKTNVFTSLCLTDPWCA
jgi:hypothetical protein